MANVERRGSEDALLDIMNDDSVCFSDSEKSSKGQENDSEALKDYWFGKKYFECVLAQKILQENIFDESLIAIDSKFEIAVQQFDYEEGLNTLRTFGMKSPQCVLMERERTAHLELLGLMGSVIRQGSESEKRAMNVTLRAGRATKAFIQHNERYASTQAQQQSTMQGQQHNSRNNTSDVPDLALYTMTLMERGAQLGLTPLYTEQTIKLAPPSFKAAVKFQDNMFEGWGSTKKQAKHEASKMACNQLGLAVL